MPELDQIITRLNRVINELPLRIAVLAVNFSKERFVQKNWIDKQEKPWLKTNKRKGSTLVASGHLKKSIRKISVTPQRVTIGTNVPYAQIHNEGGEINGIERVKAHARRQHKRKSYTRKGKRVKSSMVKEHTVKPFSRKYHRKFAARQFIGKSEELNNRIDQLIQDEFDRAISG